MVLVCVSTSCLGAGEGGKKAGTGVVRRATDSYYTVSEAPSSQDDSLDSLAGVGPTEFEANAADAHALRGLLASRRGSGSRRGRGGSRSRSSSSSRTYSRSRTREWQRRNRNRPFSKGYLRANPHMRQKKVRRPEKSPSWMRGAPIQKVDLPPSEEPLPGPICRQANTTKCKPQSNPHLNGNLQMLQRKDLYAMSYSSQPDNVYKKPTTGPVVPCSTAQDCKHLGKLCVRGECKCPVMYSGSYDCSVETKQAFDWCAGAATRSKILKVITDCPLCRRQYLFEHLWVRHTITGRNAERTAEDIVDMADFSTCAVVGSANLGNKGQEINNHTAIIRCNDGPTRKYESKLGKRTTLRVQNRDYAGWMEKKEEICLPYTLGNITENNKFTWSRFKRCQGVLPSKLALSYFKYYWDIFRPRSGKDNVLRKGVQTSAGFSAILFAMHVCGEVNVYGFSQGVGHYYRKPHVNDSNRKNWSGRHHWNYEKRCMNIMRQGKVKGVKVN